jgi:hypothetical protein
LLLLLAGWIGIYSHYIRSISPEGVRSVADYFQRFGEPARVRQVQLHDQVYYELQGHLPSKLVMSVVLPSSPPSYIFDERGNFVEWCADPGDAHAFMQRWPTSETGRVEVVTFKRRFGL